MPMNLHSLMATVTDEYTVITEHSRPSDMRPSVWEVQGADGHRWFVKQHVGPKLHRREVDAYEKWTATLGAGRAPSLAAADSTERTIVVTGVPGVSLDTLRLPAEQEREAYRQAGQLLARLHAVESERPQPVDAPAWDSVLSKRLDGAGGLVPSDVLTLLHALAEQPPAPGRQVLCHGDFMPKNWLWDASEQRLRIIDFERTEWAPATGKDLSRLHYRVLHHRPDLAAAFYIGYSRPLTPQELYARAAYAVVDALDCLRWGVDHRDLGLVDEAHTMIENLRTEHIQQVLRGRRA
ncbi:aminoglycoside phosphotransferase family protein [Streptomyces sp. NBC_01381]|uniref:aminoglycoside phosphotransferase family protein n=1 Tax=Streptomyces sp. NBC_01381 TaxID=2903845 RepID=UPI00224C863F|nr:aminoglycoside phosphotransferase family protein [Streptomyces sp. NBC_01381]MCX4666473.1 aminoglycoside phosphotransferase family protein [Streptomyces sp. NBC_01381]